MMGLEGLGGIAVRFEDEICNELQCGVLPEWGTRSPEQIGHAGPRWADVAKRSRRSLAAEHRVAMIATLDLLARGKDYEDFG